MTEYQELSKELSDIAEYFIYLSDKSDRPITNLKLQKFVYYAQAWHLVFFNRKLYDDPIEAWIHGPAIRSLYRKYKRSGFKTIEMSFDEPSAEDLPKDIKLHLNDVWAAYGGYDARYLELLTHYEEPWQEARMGLDIDETCSVEISTDTMKKYYTKRMNETAPLIENPRLL